MQTLRSATEAEQHTLESVGLGFTRRFREVIATSVEMQLFGPDGEVAFRKQPIEGYQTLFAKTELGSVWQCVALPGDVRNPSTANAELVAYNRVTDPGWHWCFIDTHIRDAVALLLPECEPFFLARLGWDARAMPVEKTLAIESGMLTTQAVFLIDYLTRRWGKGSIWPDAPEVEGIASEPDWAYFGEPACK